MIKENSNRKKYWRSPYLQEIEFLTAKMADCRFAPHIHNAFTITAVEEGTLPLYFRTGFVLLRPGVLFLAGSEAPQGVNLKGQKNFCRYRTLLLHESLFCRSFFKNPGKYRNSIVLVTSPGVSREFTKALSEIEEGSKKTLSPIIDLSEKLFSLIHKGTLIEEIALSEDVKSIKEFIDQNCLRSLDINELSQVSGFSYFYIIRKFKSEVGLSPHAYLIQQKINKAKEMLIQGCSMLSVAYDLGFFDQSHFSNTFKRVLGVSPKDYLEK